MARKYGTPHVPPKIHWQRATSQNLCLCALESWLRATPKCLSQCFVCAPIMLSRRVRYCAVWTFFFQFPTGTPCNCQPSIDESHQHYKPTNQPTNHLVYTYDLILQSFHAFFSRKSQAVTIDGAPISMTGPKDGAAPARVPRAGAQ